MMTLEEENYTLQVQLAKLQVVLQQEHHARQLAEAKLKEHEQHSKAPAATQAHKDMHASLGSADAQGEIDGLRDCLKHASQEIHHRQTQLENAKQKISNLQEEKRRLQAQLASLASAAQQHRPQNHSSVPSVHSSTMTSMLKNATPSAPGKMRRTGSQAVAPGFLEKQAVRERLCGEQVLGGGSSLSMRLMRINATWTFSQALAAAAGRPGALT
ncbi:hypothetical protein WJX72_005115 [[Myrmecia] bisecta]|uniref:Uncharacterized protein n=1 Tax=[Myrmecia] bisecta TaxID=41462 RepID=A0AAW1PU89_9CHLO